MPRPPSSCAQFERLALLALLSMQQAGAIAASPAPSPAGRWEGEARLPGQSLPLVIDLARDAQGQWLGRVTLPGRAQAGVPLAALQLRASGLSATLSAAFLVPPEPAPLLQLQWKGAEQAQGTLALNGLTAPVQLRRSGEAQLAPSEAPSLPLPDALLGTWVGRYALGGVPREVTLTLARNAQGQGSGQLLIVGRRRSELTLDEVHLGPSLLRLQARAAGIVIEGRWSAEAIDGHFEQGPFEADLPLKRPAGDPR